MNSPRSAARVRASCRRRLATSRLAFLLGLLALLVGAIPDARGAAYDLYVEIEGLTGEATARGYEGWIQALSFKQAVRVDGTATVGGGAVAKPVFDALEITKPLDRASPGLNRYCAEGSQVHRVILVVVTTLEGRITRLYEVVLEDVRVTGVGVAGTPASGETRPVETVQLSFGRIRWVYHPSDGGGAIEEEWDLVGAPKS